MTMTIVLHKLIGVGAVSSVYRASERDSGRIVALKKSRCSDLISRTMLQYEAQVLHALVGHLCIPEVYAYGRMPHFELLSMQYLGPSLGDLVDRHGALNVGQIHEIATQVLDALRYIHSKGIIHRDIKPDNIVLRVATDHLSHVYLIDFGLAARPAPLRLPLDDHNNREGKDPENVGTIWGTLPYASLNAHKGIPLSYRDDLESLSYTLFWLLRGGLPWSEYTGYGTYIGDIRQVYRQKMAYDGSRLASALPDVFGMFLDYARSMDISHYPEYDRWLAAFETLPSASSVDLHFPDRPDDNAPDVDEDPDSGSHPAPPVTIGQIVLVQILPSWIIEPCPPGYERSFIRDPSLDTEEWETTPRPGIVTDIEWNARQKLYSLTVYPLGTGGRPERSVSIFSRLDELSWTEPSLSTEPAWPLPNTFSYAFKSPLEFHLLPSQPLIPAQYLAQNADQSVPLLVKTLYEKYSRLAEPDYLRSPERDVRMHARMMMSGAKIFVRLLPLPEGADELARILHEAGDRGWFDECASAVRRYDADCGLARWTGQPSSWVRGEEELEGKELDDSYMGSDLSFWFSRQKERPKSLTLSLPPNHSYGADLDAPAVNASKISTLSPQSSVLDVLQVIDSIDERMLEGTGMGNDQ